LDKEEKENKEMPEDPVEENTGEEKIQDKAEEAVEDKQEDISKEPVKTGEPSEEPSEESETQEEDSKEEFKDDADSDIQTDEKPDEKPDEEPIDEQVDLEEKPVEVKPKKEEKKKKEEGKDDDYKYIVRIANTDIDGDKKLVHGLTSIKGIGMHIGSLIANETGIDKNLKMGDLTDSQIEKIQNALDNIINNAPSWMLNHRKDYETGNDIHLIGPEIDMQLRDEINIMKKIRSYRGIRHERGLPCRGQRTRANNRKGLTLGVSKKRV